MLIRQCAPTWPPVVSHSEGEVITPNLTDVVVSVENKGGGKLIVNLRRDQMHDPQYGVTLTIPENMVQQAILSIVRKRGATLLDIGDIKIA